MSVFLPRLVKEWEHQHVILVWSRAALEAVAKSSLLKLQRNVTTFVAKPEDVYRIVVFDSKPVKRQVSTIQLYGGEPTLAIDISNVVIEDVIKFCSKRQHVIWAFNIPYWSHFFKVIDEHAKLDDVMILTLYNDSHGIEDYRHLEESTRMSVQAKQSMCSCCMKKMVKCVENSTCGHYVCVDCMEKRLECKHSDHRREFVSILDVNTFKSCSNPECLECIYFDGLDKEIVCEQCNMCFYCSDLCKAVHFYSHQFECEL